MPVTKRKVLYRQTISEANEVGTVQNLIYIKTDINTNGACGNEDAHQRRRMILTAAAATHSSARLSNDAF